MSALSVVRSMSTPCARVSFVFFGLRKGVRLSIEDVLAGRARWCVVDGDNAPILAGMPDESVAHVITDPPYEAEAHTSQRRLRYDGEGRYADDRWTGRRGVVVRAYVTRDGLPCAEVRLADNDEVDVPQRRLRVEVCP